MPIGISRTIPGVRDHQDLRGGRRPRLAHGAAWRHAVADPLVDQAVNGKPLLGVPNEEDITPLI
jgi:hypothetical protein